MFWIHLLLYVILGLELYLVKLRRRFMCITAMVWFVYGVLFIVTPLTYEFQVMLDDNRFFAMMTAAQVMLYLILRLTGGRRRVSMVRYNVIPYFRSNYEMSLMVGVLFLLILLARLGYVVSSEGIGVLLHGNRVADRLSNYYTGGTRSLILDVIPNLLSPAIFVILCVNLRWRWAKWLVPLLLLLTGSYAFLTASHRTTVLLPLIVLMFYFHFYIRRMPMLAVVGFAVVLLIGASVFQYIRSGQIEKAFGKSYVQMVLHGMTGLATSGEFYLLYQRLTPGDFEYGQQLYYYDLVMPVPRMIWHSKPTVSFSARYTEKYYGKIGKTNKSWVRTFTVWGEGYSQFGPLGVIFYSVLLVLLIRWFIYFLSRYEGTEFLAFQFVGQLALIIRADLFACLSRVVFSVLLLMLISWFMYERVATSQPNPVFEELAA